MDNEAEEQATLFRQKQQHNLVSTGEMDIRGQTPEKKAARGFQGFTRKLTFGRAFKEKSLLLVAFLAMISYYHWTGPDASGHSTSFETFMDSQALGVRSTMSVAGILVKLLWSKICSGI